MRVHASWHRLREVRAEERQRVTQKPRGLWYGIGRSWLDWCAGELGEPLDGVRLYTLDFAPGLRVLRVESRRALRAFDREYGVGDWIDRKVDWTRVAAEWDAIEIAPYQPGAWKRVGWYYNWDVASGCVWNPAGVTVRRIREGAIT